MKSLSIRNGEASAMGKALNATLFASLGAMLGFAILLLAAIFYSPEWPDRTTILYAVTVGAILGLGAGLLWGKEALRWMIEALMNI